MRYIAFHKPYGVLSQFTPEPGSAHPTLRDFISIPGIYPVGRLDHDSEGLLLLTDDGALQHRLTDPRYAHPRTYWVQVERIPAEQALQQLRDGVAIQSHTTQPAHVRLLDPEPLLPPRNPPIRDRKSVPTAWLELTLTEGRNRQVRKMTAAIGHPTLRLVRVAIGTIRLDTLPPGQWRDVAAELHYMMEKAPLRQSRRRTMPNAYLISSSYRGGPDPAKDPSLSINENTSLSQAVGALVTQFTRHHLKPGAVDKFYIVSDGKKGTILIGTGLTVSNVKTLAPITPFITPGRDRIGAELVGFKISGDVANRDLAQAISLTLQTGVQADGETFFPKKQ